jgi:hypothetical protein
VVHTYHSSYSREASKRRPTIEAGQWKKQDPVSKITREKRTAGVAQVEEHLLTSTKP